MAAALGKALVGELIGLDEGAELVDGFLQHPWGFFAGGAQVTGGVRLSSSRPLLWFILTWFAPGKLLEAEEAAAVRLAPLALPSLERLHQGAPEAMVTAGVLKRGRG